MLLNAVEPATFTGSFESASTISKQKRFKLRSLIQVLIEERIKKLRFYEKNLGSELKESAIDFVKVTRIKL
jgi:hypothetical protein